MVVIDNLVKRYGDLTALDHLQLEVKEGEIFGLLGPNGSGKTTAINCILSLLHFDSGSITVFGQPMEVTSYDLKRNIGFIPQNVAVFDQMSVEENIDFFCGLYIRNRIERKKLVADAIAFVGLQDYVKMRPKKLSGGLLRRLNIACGIVHRPKLIIMDEPTVAVDPQSRNRILEGIVDLNKTGSTIIYTSHYMEEVEKICTQIAIIDHGRVLATGSSDTLKQLIKSKENITVQLIVLDDLQLAEIRRLPGLYEMRYEEQTLHIRFESDEHNLIKLLAYLREQNLSFGRVLTERPSLNDVFLEITGTELRD